MVSDDEVAAAVRDEGQVGVTDGLWTDAVGRPYLSAIEEDAVRVREGGQTSTLIEDERLCWRDSFSQGPDGAIYEGTHPRNLPIDSHTWAASWGKV